MGREIKAASKRLRALRDLVIGVYGPANRAAFSFVRAVEAIEHLQQDMASQAAWDLPGYACNELYFEPHLSYHPHPMMYPAGAGIPQPAGGPYGPGPYMAPYEPAAAHIAYNTAPPLVKRDKPEVQQPASTEATAAVNGKAHPAPLASEPAVAHVQTPAPEQTTPAAATTEAACVAEDVAQETVTTPSAE